MSLVTKFNQSDPFQRIRAHHFDPDEYPLEGSDIKVFESVQRLFMYRTKNKLSRRDAVQKVASEVGYSTGQVYRHYNMMADIYGEIDEANLQAERMFNREEYWFLYRQFLQERNFDGALKALDRYVATFPEIDPNEVDPEKIQAQQFVIKLQRDIAKKLNGDGVKVDGPVIDFKDLDVEDIPYNLVNDKGDES